MNRKTYILFIVLISVLLLSLSVTAGELISYDVKPGDSLYKLSHRFGTTIQRIKEANNLQSDMIYVGQVLKIPVSSLDETNSYLVRPGDSLYKLAIRFGTTVQQLKSINNLKSDMIYVGQELMIFPEQSESGTGTVTGRVTVSNRTAGSAYNQMETVDMEEELPLRENGLSTEYKKSELIVKFKPMISSQALDELEKANNLISINSLETEEGKIIQYEIPEDKEMEEIISQYNDLSNVEWAEPNYIYYPTAVPSDEYYRAYQWDFSNLNLEAAWDIQKGDKSVTVAVLDTGIISNHPDLKDNLLQGADFVGGVKSYSAESYKMTDDDPTDETPREEGGSHGTHVAGTIGAVTNNSRGVAGINWNVKILPVRGLTNKGGTSWDIAEGIYYAIDQGADIINMSFGSRHESYLQREAVREAVNEGVTIIAATGNESSSVYYPAAFKETIAVGAVGKGNTLTYYSNYGPEVDVVAPGGGYGYSIFSTWGYYDEGRTVPGYIGMSGTSMATPHVSGVAALLVANGVQEPEEIRSRLSATAVDLGPTGKDDKYGYGLIDAYAALLGKNLENTEVFAAAKSGEILNLMSDIRTVNDDGTFVLDKVKPGQVYIVAWRDVNGNGRVDRGDYYGETGRPLTITEGSSFDVDLTTYYVSGLRRKIRGE